MADDPDPFRLVQTHLGDWRAPNWVSDAYDFNNNKSSECYHCHERFLPFLQIGRISKHHCRLCGELVCRACTSKLHLPKPFEKKEKDLSRVCHACLFAVLIQRALKGDQDQQVRTRLLKYVWGPAEPPTVEEKKKLLPRVFFVPEWANEHDSASCFKCAYITQRRHHCRLCGLLFCGDCSEKLADIPQAFDKKNKPGGKRVCDYCRFDLARGWRCAYPGEKPTAAGSDYKIRDGSGQGAVLGYDNQNGSQAGGLRPIVNGAGGASSMGKVSTPAAFGGGGGGGGGGGYGNGGGLPPCAALPTPSYGGGASSPSPSPSSSSSSSAGLRPLSQCSVSTCHSSATVGGMCAQHDLANSGCPKNTPCGFEVVVRWRWEEEVAAGNQEPWAQSQALGHADLHALHNLFTEAHPRIDVAAIQYIVRGRATQKMHWRMFEARFCTPDIVIRKLQPFDHRSMAAHPPTPTPPARPGPPRQQSSPVTANRPPVVPERSPMLAPASPALLTREQMKAQSKPSRATGAVSPGATRPPSPDRSRRSNASPSLHAMSPRELLLAQSKPSRATSTGGPSPGGTRPGSPARGSPAYRPTTVTSPISQPSPMQLRAPTPDGPPPLRLGAGPPPVPAYGAGGQTGVQPGAGPRGSVMPPPLPGAGGTPIFGADGKKKWPTVNC